MARPLTHIAHLLLVAFVSCGGSTAPIAHPMTHQAFALPEPVAPWVPPPSTPIVAPGPITPPVTLTATDGTGLRLMKLVARGVVDDPVAFTELAFTFENPSERALEGTFSITLPAGAAVSRFAMKLKDDWQEGEVVELEKARVAYEDFLHRKQDPALLEQAPGNQFTARVFPIPAKGQKEIVLSYSQEMRSGVPYALPLRGLPEIGEIDVELALADPRAPLTRLKQRSYVPSGDLAVDPHIVTPRDAIRNGNLAMVRVRPSTTTQPEPLASVLVLADTSASRVLGFESELKIVSEVAKLAARTTPGARLTVACFDQDTVPIYMGDAAAFGEAELAKMRERGALGASDMGQALAWAQKHANGATRVVLVTDGVATAGATEPGDLVRAAAGLKDVGVERIDAVALGGIRDDVVLGKLASSGLAHDGVVIDPQADTSTFARRLTESTRSVEVAIEGASFVWPRRLVGMQVGDDALVYAELPAGAPLKVSLAGGAAKSIDATTVERPLLERAWTKAKIASLLDAQEHGEASHGDTKAQIIALSVSKRVLTPLTGLLVLETDADYERFKIDRHALTDVMSVDHGKVAMLKRTDIHHPEGTHDTAPIEKHSTAVTSSTPPSEVSARMMLDAKAADSSQGLGLSGIGERGGGGGSGQGFGNAQGRLGGAHQVVAPSLRQGATTVSGRLPPEVIQRIVRQNFGRFRLCYTDGLRRNPNLQGRVSTRFIIQRDGSVSTTQDAGSDLPDAAVVACIVRGFGNLSFPQPEAGIVTVVFPLLFAPGETGGGPAMVSPQHLTVPVEKPAEADPYQGRFKSVMEAIASHQAPHALDEALKWRAEAPADQMAIVALGEALEASNDPGRAARAYGSLIDMFPGRADVRRFAGVRLERVQGGLDLARDSFDKAASQRPDHPSSHRLLAYALVKRGELSKAFDVIVKGAAHTYPADRFPGVDEILHEDIGLIGAAWIKAEPARKDEIKAKMKDAKAIVESAPSIRFVLTWETDANDVDFHIYDSAGGHAFYGHPQLPSGGHLYADITTGYGPECFTIRLPPSQRARTYTLQANYYSRGPMGFGMGKLEVIDHDGSGGLKFEEHPYVVMIDQAFVNLGVIKR